MSTEPGQGQPPKSTEAETTGGGIDLAAVAKLISALEQDLAKVSTGSKHIRELREEVEELRKLLDSSADRDAGIADRLHTIRHKIESSRTPILLEAIREGQYIANIGRILGLS
jgi:hypothetical protein